MRKPSPICRSCCKCNANIAIPIREAKYCFACGLIERFEWLAQQLALVKRKHSQGGSRTLVTQFELVAPSGEKNVSRVNQKTKTRWSKGEYAWSAYRLDEAIAAMKQVVDGIPILLHLEGEKYVGGK